MRTIMFHLLANPHTLEKLYNELRSANLSHPYPKINQIQTLPYLEACLWEGVRMHPPFALPFERVVPEGGITILWYYLPAGTVVGGNPYVVNRHKGTFGQDAEFWRPERWLEKDKEHKNKLERSVLTVSLTLITSSRPSVSLICPSPLCYIVEFAVSVANVLDTVRCWPACLPR